MNFKKNIAMPRGNIVQRFAASTAVKKENRAIANRGPGISTSEARKAHRRSNARAVASMRRG